MKKSTLSTIWSQKGLYGRLFLTGEVLFILRPLAYVIMIRKYGIRSWTPWLLSLAMDLTGMSMLSYVTSPSPGSGEKFYQLSSREKEEVSACSISLKCLLSDF